MMPGKDTARVRLSLVGATVWLFGTVMLLSPLTQPARAVAAPKRILALYWYNKDFPGNVTFDQSFQAILGAEPAGTIEYYPEYLESNRFPGESQSRLLRDYLQHKYADRAIDVIVAVSDAPLEFLLKYRNDIFTNTPIVFVAIRRPTSKEVAAGPGLTGIIQGVGYRNNFELALRLHPDAQQVFIVSGTIDHDKMYEKLCREELQGYEGRVSVNYLTDLPLHELIFKTKSLPKRSVVLYIWQQSQNESGRVLESRDVLASIAGSTNAPIYGVASWQIGLGIVGGHLRTLERIGTRSAEIALRIAHGGRTLDIPVENPRTVPMFDWRELKRWGISEELLPPGSSILFREPTFWELYRWRIVGVISFCFIETLLIIGLLLNRRKRRRVELSLRQGEERFRQVAETVSDFVWEVDADGLYQYTSPSVERILGYTPDELVGKKHFYDLFVPDLREQLKTAAFVAFRSRQRIHAFHDSKVSKSGSIVYLETSGVPILNKDGLLLGYRCAGTDVSDRRRSEMEMLFLRQELGHFSRVATVGELTASIAHELSQPLAAILGNSQAAKRMLQRGFPDLKELDEIFDDIVADNQRAVDIIRSMRSLLKRGGGEHRALSFNSLIEDVVRIVRKDALMKKISLVLDLGAPIAAIEGDRIQLQQVILNLVMNAFEAMEASEPPRELVLRTRQDDGEIRLDVIDSGSGIAADKLNSIFEPFFTTKTAGLGLGLSLSHSIVTAHNGRLWAENNIMTGATFHLALPGGSGD